MSKKYWQSLEQYHEEPDIDQHKSESKQKNDLMELMGDEALQKKSSRRNFLKFCGFTVSSAAIASSCENPVKKAIPFLNRPAEMTPGEADFYASTFFDGNEFCSILVKNRDGRPIKIEGNDLSPFTKGGTTANVQSSILSLYDSGGRYKQPMKEDKRSSWKQVDPEIKDKLEAIKEKDGEIVLLTSSIISPTAKQSIADFRKYYPSAKHVTYDAVSQTGMLRANKRSFNKQVIPSYHFDQADVIVSFGADFLGTWISPAEFTLQYSKNRKLNAGKDTMSQHIQFEAGMSLTGSNADRRIPIKPSEEGIQLANLYNIIARKMGETSFNVPSARINMKNVAAKLMNNRGRSLVVSGSNDVNIQVLVNAINQLLGNYGKTIDLSRPVYIKQGIDSEMRDLVNRMNQGKVEALIMHNVNPAYDYPDAGEFSKGLNKVDLTIHMGHAKNETSKKATYVCPDNHYLESWGDALPKEGFYSLQQPLIRKLYTTRQWQESLLKWAGKSINYLDYLKKHWETNIYPNKAGLESFSSWWNKTLQKGVLDTGKDNGQPDYTTRGLRQAANSIKKSNNKGFELVFYESVALRDGKQANNPWLQELPDPIAKISWDNFAAIPVQWGEEKGLKNGDIIKVDGIELPVFLQPGQAKGTIAVAYGYGRSETGKVADGVGKNVFAHIPFQSGIRYNTKPGVEVSVTGKHMELALSQTHHSMEGRDIVRETTLDEYKKDHAAGNHAHEEFVKHHKESLYKKQEFPGHHWGLIVDLNSCIGCSNCMVACQAENNVPVVGKEQVKNRRIMHWIRVDRYFSGDTEDTGTHHQPVMCQHCDNAPCENVCPVAATMHSDEGLNQMAYNRCIGTKYCINNCPYKVRRFNWYRYVTNNEFDYNMNDEVGLMALNPDVTVRERGVVEKCTFCVQRIQEKKLQAKKEGRPLKDGDVQPACVQSCPAKALTFGDLNDPDSEVSKLVKDKRNYGLLEQLHTLPSVNYLTKVRNKPEELEEV
ncbi:MAG: TAT-variant-translocated molybdopterin oxidoreductase [Bacteroidales bacterium]|nr:TAT-variant-translocated molybdopterin oxidoreductase [Bacteroidales bacterium]